MSPFERFILIDDNEADNVFHEIMIRRAGFTGEVLIFENGIDALKWFTHDLDAVPTCVFLDINMPMMDGFEVAENAAPLIEKKPTVMVVMLTSSGSPADKERALTLPVIQGYVTKPLTSEQVKALMAPPGA
ncbi:response regulator [Hydrogenophaga sp. PAMC20947]|uniref:response regulator n=1 Tax=Hydrogenophaga sp. PAMC20947 TaxID=2565558 RepID=UPI0014465A3D|nr:response regulator [Hydrogenophaga sp. PAMC20947]